MASKRGQSLARPLKRSEYQIRCATREAEQGWQDLTATARNAAVDAWDFLTKTPRERSDRCHPLRGDLASVQVAGVTLDQWQYEVTSGGRIWFVVSGSPDGRTAGVILLLRVATGHPNETVKQFR
ncbi:hypothetical protein [Mycobacterium sp.]|uniref:hypothetical protein n=1 Tax=Mycobacterium sp. TaxID=1785 RepID=UPI0031D1C1B6